MSRKRWLYTEAIAVVVVLVVAFAVAVPRFRGAQLTAQLEKCRSDLEAIASAMIAYQVDCVRDGRDPNEVIVRLRKTTRPRKPGRTRFQEEWSQLLGPQYDLDRIHCPTRHFGRRRRGTDFDTGETRFSASVYLAARPPWLEELPIYPPKDVVQFDISNGIRSDGCVLVSVKRGYIQDASGMTHCVTSELKYPPLLWHIPSRGYAEERWHAAEKEHEPEP